MPDKTADEAIDELLAAGLLARWWCPTCQDYVLYRTLEMDEGESRYLHAERHTERVSGA
jgi:hypothetical protein